MSRAATARRVTTKSRATTTKKTVAKSPRLTLVTPAKPARRATPVAKSSGAATVGDIQSLVRAQEELVGALETAGYLSSTEADRLRNGLRGRNISASAQDRAAARAAQLSERLRQLLQDGRATSAKHASRSLDVLDEIAQVCSTYVDSSELFAAVLATLQHAVPFEGGTLFLLDPDTERLQPVATRGRHVNLIEGVNFQLGSGFSAWVGREKKPVLLNNLHRTTQATVPAVRSFLCVPLLVADQLIGVVNLSHSQPSAFTEEHKRLLVLVGAQAAAVLQRVAMARATAQITIRDELTGLYNKRHFEERLAHEVERARRHGNPLSLLLVDVDNFTGINDSLGSEGGDRILGALGHLFQTTSRASDVVARWTGEKFAFLLPNTDHEGAMIAAERARGVVASYLFPRRRRLAVSVGVATLPRDAADGQRLVSQADIALYLAKSSGKNRSSACPAPAASDAESATA